MPAQNRYSKLLLIDSPASPLLRGPLSLLLLAALSLPLSHAPVLVVGLGADVAPLSVTQEGCGHLE